MLRECSDEDVSGGAVKGESEDSKKFAVRVGIHQESILSPLIFAVVMDVVTKEGHALMYADDLVLICETKEEARQRFEAWRNTLESKGLKVNISKTKVMRCAWDIGILCQRRQQWTHAVCVERGWV